MRKPYTQIQTQFLDELQQLLSKYEAKFTINGDEHNGSDLAIFIGNDTMLYASSNDNLEINANNLKNEFWNYNEPINSRQS